MISAVLSFCIRERLLVLLALLAAIAGGWHAAQTVPIDAIPNVGENQVIVLTEWPGRSPKDIEDQITYPLSVALQAVPGADSVRGRSMFGFSFVQVTFADSVDPYWARSRVSEQLTTVSGTLPDDVRPTLAPDATALGQIFYYVLIPPKGMDLAELRSKQDFFVKYSLQSVKGVAEVASIGGYVRQYQIDVHPNELRYHNLTLNEVIAAVKASNIDVGAKTVEQNGMEFIVRGRGFIGSGKTESETIKQIEDTVVRTQDGVPLTIGDLASVQIGPSFRRGALDFNGAEAVGGIVVMRYGENPRLVIERLQKKIDSLERDLGGVQIVGVYDRTQLIDETIATLTTALKEETLITIVVMVLFLLHVRASLIIAITLPAAVLMSFIAMKMFGVDANIMSLAGIAIAIGTMVDMGIIVLENVYEALAEWEQRDPAADSRSRTEVIRSAAGEVIPAVMTAVTTTIVSFLPVFFLTGRDHRLFAPLAWTKTFALAASLIVAVTVVPMLCRVLLSTGRRRTWRTFGSTSGLSVVLILLARIWHEELAGFIGLPRVGIDAMAAVLGCVLGWWISRERLRPMEQNPVSRFVRWLYGGRLRFALRHKALALMIPCLILFIGVGAWIGLPTLLDPVEELANRCGAELNDVPGYVDLKHTFTGLKSDDWIALDEGSWFYMPSLYPAAGFNQSLEVLQTQDAMISQIPEVAAVLGKIGRADSALDPAPASMIETYVMLKPKSLWRAGVTERSIWDEINRVATMPGVTPAAPLQPIEGRVVMLQSGIKAAMAVRIYGDDLQSLADAAVAVADHLKTLPIVNAGTVSPDIVMGKPYIEFDVDRKQAARYGMSTRMVNQVVASGLGGLDVTETVEGRERYPIQVRFDRSVREDVNDLNRVPIVTPTGETVPLENLAKMSQVWGPGAISSENARLVAHVSFAPARAGSDLETVDAVMTSLNGARENSDSKQSAALDLPDGNFELEAVGSFQNQIEANQRLMWIIPAVILINLLLHYLHFRNLPLSLVVFSGIPFAAAGGMIAVATMGVAANTAMWVGFIALFGLAADDGIVIATYMKKVLDEREIQSVEQLREAIFDAGLKRVRPCLMTTITTLAALIPVLISTGRGADVARAMALPVFGGMLIEPFTSFIVPTLYCGYREFLMRAGFDGRQVPDNNDPSPESPQPV